MAAPLARSQGGCPPPASRRWPLSRAASRRAVRRPPGGPHLGGPPRASRGPYRPGLPEPTRTAPTDRFDEVREGGVPAFLDRQGEATAKRETSSLDRVAGIVRGSDPGPLPPLVHSAREPGSDEPDRPVVERDRGPCAALPKLHESRNQGTGFGDVLGDRARGLLAAVARLPKGGPSHLPDGEARCPRPSTRSRGWRRIRRARRCAHPARPPCAPPRRRRPGSRSSCLLDSSAPSPSSLRPRPAVVVCARPGAAVRRSSRSWRARGGGKR